MSKIALVINIVGGLIFLVAMILQFLDGNSVMGMLNLLVFIHFMNQIQYQVDAFIVKLIVNQNSLIIDQNKLIIEKLNDNHPT